MVGFYKQDDIHPDGRIDTGYGYWVYASDWEDFAGATGRHHVQGLSQVMWSNIREGIRRATGIVAELVLDVTGTQNPDA